MKKILVVEDSRTMRAWLKAVLEDEGYYVDVTDSGRIAFDVAKDGLYDMFILDYALPDTTGSQLSSKIRDINKYKDTPIIIFSGINTDQKSQAMSKHGVTEWIRKSTKGEIFVERINEYFSDK